jgi:hypothetical protein
LKLIKLLEKVREVDAIKEKEKLFFSYNQSDGKDFLDEKFSEREREKKEKKEKLTQPNAKIRDKFSVAKLII